MKSLLTVFCVNVCWETSTCSIDSILGSAAVEAGRTSSAPHPKKF